MADSTYDPYAPDIVNSALAALTNQNAPQLAYLQSLATAASRSAGSGAAQYQGAISGALNRGAAAANDQINYALAANAINQQQAQSLYPHYDLAEQLANDTLSNVLSQLGLQEEGARLTNANAVRNYNYDVTARGAGTSQGTRDQLSAYQSDLLNQLGIFGTQRTNAQIQNKAALDQILQQRQGTGFDLQRFANEAARLEASRAGVGASLDEQLARLAAAAYSDQSAAFDRQQQAAYQYAQLQNQIGQQAYGFGAAAAASGAPLTYTLPASWSQTPQTPTNTPLSSFDPGMFG